MNHEVMSANEPIIVCLGRFGDECVILPLLYHRFQTSGEKQKVIVAKNYAEIFEGVSYVEPAVYEADFLYGDRRNDFKAVGEFARSKFGGQSLAFVNPVYSEGGKPVNRTDSFAKEMWLRAGDTSGWGRLPLVFDRRDSARESKLAKILSDKPVILAGLNGISSPFEFKDELLARLAVEFPTCQIVDLANVRAERVYDLLGLYDRAALLIGTDTLHLHLSRASKVPTIALAQDQPQKWNGVPWEARYVFYCRYSKYRQQADNLFGAAQDVLDGIAKPKTVPINRVAAEGYNPSILQYNNQLLFSYRHHPQRSRETKLRIAILGDNYENVSDRELYPPPGMEKYSHEDARLFLHRGRPFVSYTMAVLETGRTMTNPKCVIGYGELVFGERWMVKEHFQPVYGKNNWTGMEKNWVFFSHADRLYCIYHCHPDQLVLEIEGNRVVKEYRSNVPAWKWGEIRGGTSPVLFNGRWVRFFHSRLDSRYYVGACEVEMEPPFQMVKVSTRPIICGHEWRHPAFHWKPHVAIPYGSVVQGEKIVMAVGINDVRACVAELTEKNLKLI